MTSELRPPTEDSPLSDPACASDAPTTGAAEGPRSASSLAPEAHRTCTRLVVDAHVHVYDHFDAGAFYTRAAENLARLAAPAAAEGFLLLTETAEDHAFEAMSSACAAGRAVAPGWHAIATGDPECLRLEDDEGRGLWIVAGRQIVTAEDLEVLALGLNDRLADGSPIRNVIPRVRALGAVPVLPWGFGKWLGARGRVMRSLVEEAGTSEAGAPPPFLLGDNRGRPRLWPDPHLFQLGRAGSLAVLPGSDPLPTSTGAANAGSYGFVLEADFDALEPWRSLRAVLETPGLDIRSLGRRESAFRFVRDQIAMQLRKRVHRRSPSS